MKKLLLLGLMLFILAIISYFGNQIYHKIEVKKAFEAQAKHTPNPSVFQWVGKAASIAKASTIILFFHPECEHCQYEAKVISEKQQDFVGTNIWWVSMADSAVIRGFSKKYGLQNLPNNYFGHLPGEKITQTFGSVSVPHIFIYDKHQVLQKEFKGETKIEALLKYAQAN